MSNNRFENSGDGVKELEGLYNSWTLKLTEVCMHASYAIIAGLYAAFGSAGKLLDSLFAVLSLVCVFIVLAANVVIRKIITSELFNRIEYAEGNKDKWVKEFNDYQENGGAWPYTTTIEGWGKALRCISTWGVAIATLFLIIGIALELNI